MRLQRLDGDTGPLRGPSVTARQMASSPAVTPVKSSDDGAQLSMLGSVLNGLETGATAMRGKLLGLRETVRSGSYQVNPALLSSRIVDDSLAGRA